MGGRAVDWLGAATPGRAADSPESGSDAKKTSGHLGDRVRAIWAAVCRFKAAAAGDRVTGVAAEVAFYAFLGIFPGLLALAATLGFLDRVVGGDVAAQAQGIVVDFLSDFFGSEAGGTVEAVEALFHDSDVALLSFAGAGAVWSMWRATRAAMRALAVVYDVEEGRSAVRLAATALAVSIATLLLAVLVLVMFVVGPLFGGGRAVADALGLGELFATLWTWARIPAGFALLVVWAAVLFRLASHRRSWRAQLPGAVSTGVLWLAFSGGFQVYLRVAAGSNQVLGVIGGVMTVLLWLYLLSLALLLGAELNAVVDTSRGPARSCTRRDGVAGRARHEQEGEQVPGVEDGAMPGSRQVSGETAPLAEGGSDGASPTDRSTAG